MKCVDCKYFQRCGVETGMCTVPYNNGYRRNIRIAPESECEVPHLVQMNEERRDVPAWCVDCHRRYPASRWSIYQARCPQCQAKYEEKHNKLSYRQRHGISKNRWNHWQEYVKYDPVLVGKVTK